MDLAHFRERLREEERFVRERIDMIEETGLGFTSHGDQLQEDSTIDNHPADLGTEMFEREKDLGLLTANHRRLREIKAAYGRLQDGTYGTCEECGREIPDERLEVAPAASLCVECQTRQEALPDRFQRPIEEQLLSPPFGRTWRGGTGDPGYDGEDAWQEVAQYGTSETPQDVPGAVTYDDMYNMDEDTYGIVDPMDMYVDEDGEPLIQRDMRDDVGVLFAAPESKWRVGLFGHRTHYVPRGRR